MDSKKSSKLEILKLLQKHKSVLFGTFSDKLTKKDKIQKWKQIHNHALAMELVPRGKDFRYTRDTFWQNIRKNSIKRIENQSFKKNEDGSKIILNEIDEIVFDILSKDNSDDDLPANGTCDNEANEIKNEIVYLNISQPSTTEIRSESEADSQASSIAEPCPHNNSVNKQELTLEELQMQKMKISIQILKMEKYLKQLEILQKEKELGIKNFNFSNLESDAELYNGLASSWDD